MEQEEYKTCNLVSRSMVLGSHAFLAHLVNGPSGDLGDPSEDCSPYLFIAEMTW